LTQNQRVMNLARFPQFNRHKVWTGLLIGFTSLMARADLPMDQAKLAAANTGFAFDLLKQIVKEQPEANVFISPFSVSTVLQMVGNGAAGETRTEMQDVLKTGGLPAEALNRAVKSLDQSLNSQTNVILDLANAIWYQEGVQLKSGFVSDNQNYFAAKLGGVDFKNLESAQTINDWADKSTRGKIKEVVRWPLPPLTRVILANAIYFKGEWDRPFETNATQPHVFHLSGSGEIQVPTMWQRGSFSYQEGDGYQAVRLPYAGGRLRMYLFLPDANSGPAKLLAGLNSASWRDKILPRFVEREGTLALPRFKLNYDVELNNPLETLGMKSAFTPAADFSAMADEPLCISAVKQKSFVDVNEEGTEAAAVTTVVMKSLAVMEPVKSFEMIVDRPFFFVIEDNQTGSILFMGVVHDPAP
jgi:serine protease inhibitor